MNSRFYKDLTPVLNANGMIGTKIYVQPEGEIVHLEFEPKAHLKAHKTPVNVAFFVLEGTATLTIGEESQSFPAGTIIDSPKDIPHAVTNEGDALMRILVIKMPKP
ncbi:MAG: cupin domain-containing protein [Candidatus Cloacimonetes bacterium]|jgi:quercetin dioxygenase-like cupin family protein|nr:cupin domain-containing protein [Candidatus Cloacimonadota bacterium]MCB5286936.1 cupin domain-containing protein [Candidatus Cloacimonadota bacterium]MCK9185435.1 cupin domain-containing protein [Candidatus Cloacimonadota bacterium]MCK9584351.1 cupin domain-containing protein [Candidatus Cloacimonadota bacterium]MDY0229257.1 cupin domain-containing protein [Candidatus Cloacimonadaceae bacterium]